MGGINIHSFIRLYVNLFTNNIYFGNDKECLPLGQALIDFIYADLDRFQDTSLCQTGSFDSVHPYFRCCSDEWESSFLRNLSSSQPDPGFFSLEDLLQIQMEYREIMEDLFGSGFDYAASQFVTVLSKNAALLDKKSYNLVSLKAQEHDDCYMDYFLNSFEEVLYIELLEVLRHKVTIIPCKNCGRLFVQKRINSDYCQRVFTADGKTCAQIGCARTFSMAVKNDELLMAYTKAYKAHYAHMTKPRKRVRNMTRDEFSFWYREAKEKLGQARAGTLDAEEFKAWLKQ